MYDSNGNVKPTRLSALLNAALGHVADQTQGFIDFDAVPDEGASIQVWPTKCICNVCLLSTGCLERGWEGVVGLIGVLRVTYMGFAERSYATL